MAATELKSKSRRTESAASLTPDQLVVAEALHIGYKAASRMIADGTLFKMNDVAEDAKERPRVVSGLVQLSRDQIEDRFASYGGVPIFGAHGMCTGRLSTPLPKRHVDIVGLDQLGRQEMILYRDRFLKAGLRDEEVERLVCRGSLMKIKDTIDDHLSMANVNLKARVDLEALTITFSTLKRARHGLAA